MSKKVKYPNGYIGFASDSAAKVLAKKPDHKIVGDIDEKKQKKGDTEDQNLENKDKE